MIKDNLIYTLYIAVLAVIHLLLSKGIDMIIINRPALGCYFVLVILSFMGNTVFSLQTRSSNIEFPQAFMIVTTLQLLGAMSFAAYLRYTIVDDMKTIVLQFVAAFILFLIFQSIYLIKTKAKK
tara:strand:+ start:127823 stop:128194 length:372 start_codon:yes stop_codon:yes gene_type:complete